MISRALLLALTLAACTTSPPGRPTPQAASPAQERSGKVGVLVMAHGGDAAWNQTVADAAGGLGEVVPTAIAYGMANPYTLGAGLDSLRAEGVDRVAVVRMFVSGRSFLEQTNYLLGLSPTPPERFVLMGPEARSMGTTPIDHGLQVESHPEGLMGSAQATAIMLDRAMALSRDPGAESVLLLAHGMGDESENGQVLRAMRTIGRGIRAHGFHTVEVATLREDWMDKRAVSEREIRAFVAAETDRGRRVLVLPMRLSGFGPYAEVLDGLIYAAGEGLLPHELVADWLRETASGVSCRAGWGPAITSCDARVAAEPWRE